MAGLHGRPDAVTLEKKVTREFERVTSRTKNIRSDS